MIYVIMGPTASGKTDVANFLIEKLGCEAINADAFQIYKGMDIGTNKLDKNDRFYTKYHLIDIIEPDQQYSVKEYQEAFRLTINKLLKEKKDVVVVGGTGLYIKAALYDYIFIKEENTDDSKYENFSNVELFSLLQAKDKKACENIHVNNRKRLIRALNLIESSGRKKTDIINSQKHKLVYDNVKFLFINPNREILYENINNRVDQMIENGLENEVRKLIQKYNLSKTSFQGIGYKEMIDYINGIIDFNTCVDLIKKRTRNYAKRQVTFFKNQFKSQEFSCKSSIISEINNGKII